MIASIDVSQLLAETDRLVELLLQSVEVQHYHTCAKLVQEDPEAQRLIRQFVAKKEKFEEVERFGKYHPDYQAVKQEMREYKRQLDLYEPVAQFKKAEKEVESILQEVSRLIAGSVSATIKVPTNPFWDMQGCGGGGCGSGSCGSCG